MIVSLNWLKKFTEIESSPEELAQLIGSRLVEIEEIIDLGDRYRGIVVAEIKRVEAHSNADKLNVYWADDAGATPDVERGEDGLVQVVSGDKNLKEGDKVAWLPPGARVPASVAEGQPFVLGSREMRGVISHGMFGSGKELELNNDAERVAVLDTAAPAGTPFADAYELNDYLFDIANKSLTHRPDCFGLVGFAREVAAIQGKPFHTPDWLAVLEPALSDPQAVEGVLPVEVRIDDAGMCPRYQAAVIANVDVSLHSPLIIQSYLKRLGVRPINAVVDVTNYLMLVTGHPLHAFDYDKVAALRPGGAPLINVRGGRPGDTLTLLDGRTIEPTHEDILICADDTPIGLAGAMGGQDTEISDTTKNIILESATFNLYNLRGTTMRHGIFSEAATRFTKGQAAAQTAPVLASAVRMMADIAGGTLAAPVQDVYPGRSEPVTVPVTSDFINRLLGTDYPADDISRTLQHVNCEVTREDETLQVRVPYWRQDLHIPEDIAEEVGRINGFDSIKPIMPLRPYEAVMPPAQFTFQSRVRDYLVRMGANEVLTYSFVPERLLQAANQDPALAFKIVNAISPSLQYYRLSLTPSLLEKAYLNSKAGYHDFALFEFNKVHTKGRSEPDGVPAERRMLALSFTGVKRSEATYGAPYYAAKQFLARLLAHLGVQPEYVGMQESTPAEWAEIIKPYDPSRSAYVKVDGQTIGCVGEISPATAKRLKIPAYTAAFEVDVDALQALANLKPQYQPLGRFQGTTYDICFKTDPGVTYTRINDAVSQALKASGLIWSVSPLDRFQREGEASLQTTLRLELADPEATLTSQKIHQVIDTVIQKTAQETGAEVI